MDFGEFVPGASVKCASARGWSGSSPLLEEERDAGNDALVPNAPDPVGLHPARFTGSITAEC